MVDKRFPVIYSLIFGFLAAVMIVLMTVLFVEYRFFCNQAREMMALKEQYAQCVDLLNRKMNGTMADDIADSSGDGFDEVPESMDGEEPDDSSIAIEEIMAAEASDEPDDDDDYVDDSFVVINRQSDYLKQSTLDYMESQELNALMTAIDVDRWSDYSPQATVVRPPVKKTSFAKTICKPALAIRKPVITQKKTHITAMRRPTKECGFMWPIDKDKFWLSSLFGARKRIDGTWGFHHGIDMAAVKGTIIKAARAGTITEASFQTGYGNTVVVQHTQNLKTRYAHLHTIRVCVGQKVNQAAIVGTVGETGFIRKKGKDGSHLHFEVYEYGKRVNPMHCLPRTA